MMMDQFAVGALPVWWWQFLQDGTKLLGATDSGVPSINWIHGTCHWKVMDDDDDDDTKQLGPNCLSLTPFCAYPGRRTLHLCLCVWWAFPNADLRRDDTASVFSSVLLALPNFPSHILLQFFFVFWTWIVLEGIDITLSRLLSRQTYMQARLSENWVESQSGNPSTHEP